MVTGWDKTGPQLYYVDNDATRINGNLFAVGSGSTFAYGVLDTYYREDLTVDEAIEVSTCLRLTPCVSASLFRTHAYFHTLTLSHHHTTSPHLPLQLGKRAIVAATHRDAYSGGMNNVYHVGPNGWTQVHRGDTTQMFYEYYPDKIQDKV